MTPLPPGLISSMLASSSLMLGLVGLLLVYTATQTVIAAGKRIGFILISGVLLIGWFATAVTLARRGFFIGTSFSFLPNIALLFVPIMAVLTILAKSSTFKIITANIPQTGLMAIQTFRIMGVAFLMLYIQGLMPAEFAIPSGIGDVIIGTTAPLMAYLVTTKRSESKILAVIWNIAGFGELSLAIVLGFSTSPTPYQTLALNNPNDLLFAYPLALIPTFVVPLSLILHIFSLRILLKKKTAGFS